jgi:hypothetical protein
MKVIKILLFNLLCTIVLVSCGNDSNDESLVLKKKIPIDSIYFSCKLNGNLIEMNSASIVDRSYGAFITRLFKLKNSPNDSVIIGYKYGFYNADYSVVIGLSKACILDTLSIQNFYIPKGIKNEIMEKSSYQMQFMPPISTVKLSSVRYSGFYIEICDLKKELNYTTYLNDFSEYNNEVEYNKVSTNSGLNLIKSTALNSGIYADYLNTWFIESNFKCRIHRTGKSAYIMEEVTDGVLRGCF